MTHELKVEKRAQAVRIFMDDGSVIPASIYLTWMFEDSISGQRIAEAVEGSAPALPCMGASGAFMILGTGSISGVAVPLADTWDEGFFHLRPAKVTLRGGHQVDGFVRHYVGTGDRLSDAFRRQDEWIQMEVGAEVLWFRVNGLLSAEEITSRGGTQWDPVGSVAEPGWEVPTQVPAAPGETAETIEVETDSEA